MIIIDAQKPEIANRKMAGSRQKEGFLKKYVFKI
jgi:hypothetical protein